MTNGEGYTKEVRNTFITGTFNKASENVKEALTDKDSILHYMQRLIKMRKENEVAIYGDFQEYEPENEQLYIYERNFEEKQMLVVLNFSEERAKFTMPEEWKGKKTELLITNYPGEKELMAHKEPDRVPVMCQLSQGYMAKNGGETPFDMYFNAESAARAFFKTRKDLDFDGILLNVCFEDNWREIYGHRGY